MENEAAAQPQTFQQRKTAQLAEERTGEALLQPQPDLAPLEGTPEPELESARSEPEEDAPESQIEPEPGLTEEGGLTEETPAEEGQEGEEEDQTIDWQKRFEDTRQKLSEVTANRTEMEREHAEMLTTQLNLKHELEDKLTQASRYVDAYKGGFDQQIAALEQAFNSGQIEPENLPAARQQYQALQQQRQALQQQMDDLTRQQEDLQSVERRRQAEIARVRLSRSIPGWSREKHQELGEYAMSRGFTADEFSNNLDYRFLELLHDSMQLNRAPETLTEVTRHKKAPAPRQNARKQPRSADGKFRKAEQDFWQNPGQRGRFADMKAAQLAKERGRR